MALAIVIDVEVAGSGSEYETIGALDYITTIVLLLWFLNVPRLIPLGGFFESFRFKASTSDILMLLFSCPVRCDSCEDVK